MLYDDRVCKEVLSKSRVLSIFGVTSPGLNELITWTEKSDDHFFLFFEHVGGNIHRKKLFGTGYDRSSGRKIFWLFLVTDKSESGFHLPGERDINIFIFKLLFALLARRRRKICFVFDTLINLPLILLGFLTFSKFR